MRLDDWISRKGMTREAFAALIDVEPASVTRYANGDRVPRPTIMRRIVTATNGDVTPNDFLTGEEPIPNPNDDDAPDNSAPVVTAAE